MDIYCHFLAILKNALMNLGVQLSIPVSFVSSLEFIPRSGLAGSYSNAMFNFLRIKWSRIAGSYSNAMFNFLRKKSLFLREEHVHSGIRIPLSFKF